MLMLSILPFSLLIHIVLGAKPLSYRCSNSKANVTSDSHYQTNLNKILASLHIKSPFDGFGIGSVGLSQDWTHGLALCCGDVNATNSGACRLAAISANSACTTHKTSYADPAMFNKQTRNLLSRLSNQAYADPKMYARGELQFDESTKIYGYVQCTRDLSNVDCKTCLDSAIGELPSCYNGKQGGRVVGGSCKVCLGT